jgi:hypothetical protein
MRSSATEPFWGGWNVAHSLAFLVIPSVLPSESVSRPFPLPASNITLTLFTQPYFHPFKKCRAKQKIPPIVWPSPESNGWHCFNHLTGYPIWIADAHQRYQAFPEWSVCYLCHSLLWCFLPDGGSTLQQSQLEVYQFKTLGCCLVASF